MPIKKKYEHREKIQSYVYALVEGREPGDALAQVNKEIESVILMDKAVFQKKFSVQDPYRETGYLAPPRNFLGGSKFSACFFNDGDGQQGSYLTNLEYYKEQLVIELNNEKVELVRECRRLSALAQDKRNTYHW